MDSRNRRQAAAQPAAGALYRRMLRLRRRARSRIAAASAWLRSIQTIDDLCSFMKVFGPIDQSAGMLPTDDRRQTLAQVIADGYISDIAALVDYQLERRQRGRSAGAGRQADNSRRAATEAGCALGHRIAVHARPAEV
ncbi:hypothetical protein MES5069_550127 [Mesorhizobium escarrei]|uniref:Uncharacterized protein n=1 Tax=Mesorhizobium escarrei TaxID=666018 RepID=A0ABN8K9Z2_9HYPH|nr:hypothetical protein MES5069_550127 [Mesorhizobium escarrei]